MPTEFYEEKTDKSNASNTSIVTIFDGCLEPHVIKLETFGKSPISFGRNTESVTNDIGLKSNIVSRKQGRFVFKNNMWFIEDVLAYDRDNVSGNHNCLIHNDASIISYPINDGDFIRIDDGIETVPEGILFVFSSVDSPNKWHNLSLSDKRELSIGRDRKCDIVLPHITVSKKHAKIIHESDGWYIVDNNSTNGVIVNNKRISGKQKLNEKDVIVITNSKLIFTSSLISYYYCKTGVSVDASDIVIKRRDKGNKTKITTNHVDLNIKGGELISIVGGSGAGKSTILNCMSGYLKPTNGNVFINGINLYQNFNSLKKLIGYVPQADIVYDNLTLYDMLSYTSKLRLPNDTSPQERDEAIKRAINLVELNDKRDSLIKNLSGGQRKRASIAVELLSDPNLLFLDEPASGLDPGTERSLMKTLRNMANAGKTVILVTHSTLQLKMCDKIVFMGNGGNLCYFGTYDDALQFFKVEDIVDVYNKINESAKYWSEEYKKYRGIIETPVNKTTLFSKKSKENRFKQFGVLSARYFKLVANDTQRLILLLVQAPLLAALISLVANGKQFEQYEMTKSLLFALSCSAFWVGMLNSIQEICKERTILKREYMTGLSLTSYLLSKISVLGFLCLIQSAMITGVFGLMVGLPEEGVITQPFLELVMTTFLTALTSSAMGLFVSSLFSNADRAMTVAPILLMPQILFSGLIFKLSGATEIISWFAVCRWSMEGYGTTANLNDLPLKLQQEGIMLPHEAENFFDFTTSHLLSVWAILLLFMVIFLILARIVLSGIDNKK